jgi:hypothetical protein
VRRAWAAVALGSLLLGGPARGDELSATGLNTLRYGSGQILDELNNRELDREFFEETLDLDLTRGSLRANLATAVAWPSEFPDSPPRADSISIKRVDLLRRSLEWNGPVTVQVGHFWTTFGSGLALSLFRDESLVNPRLVGNAREELPASWDSRGDGALVEALKGDWTLKALWGNSDYVGRLTGANVEWTRPLGSLGGSLVRAGGVPQNDDIRFGSLPTLDLVNQELYGTLRLGRAELTLDHLEQRQLDNEAVNAGAGGLATYVAAGAPLAGWSLLAEYKYYRFARQTLYFNSPPTVQREIPTRLIARSTHRVFSNQDETGLMLDLSRSFTGGHSLHFSGAWASHIGGGVLPSLEEALSAYQEYCAGWLMDFAPGRRLDLGAAYTEETNGWLPGGQASLGAPWYRRAGLSAAWLTTVPLLRSLELAGEVMRMRELREGRTSEGLLLWAEIFPSTAFSFNLTADYKEPSNRQEELSPWRQDWMGSAEARADFHFPVGLSHTLTVFAGRLRGGQVCSNGNCRIVAPFNGVKLTLASQF